jgi:hypothetical protein
MKKSQIFLKMQRRNIKHRSSAVFVVSSLKDRKENQRCGWFHGVSINLIGLGKKEKSSDTILNELNCFTIHQPQA